MEPKDRVAQRGGASRLGGVGWGQRGGVGQRGGASRYGGVGSEAMGVGVRGVDPAG